MRVWRESLGADHHHAMGEQRLFQRCELRITERIQIEIGDLCTDRAGEFSELHALSKQANLLLCKQIRLAAGIGHTVMNALNRSALRHDDAYTNT